MSRPSPRRPGRTRRRPARPGRARTEPGTEEPVPIEQLGHGAAELLSLTNGGEARSLNKLAELAAWQVPSCSGANAVVWRDGEVVSVASTHPDLAELADIELQAGTGPLLEAVQRCAAVSCPDTLDETRWPEFSEAALRRGVRCSVHLVRELPHGALVLSLFGVRPGVLADEALKRLRQESQRRHIKVTEVATEVVAAYDGGN